MIDFAKIADIIRHVAAVEVMPRFKNLQAGDVREKKPGDFVTVADEASEKLFTRLLSEALPDSLVVGEEAVAQDPSILARLKDDRPVWVIDPIDGTYNFSHGRSRFGILIALVKGGETIGGWMFDAPGNRMVVAEKGAGAYLDGARLRVEEKTADMARMTGRAGGAQAWHFDPVTPLFRELKNYRCSLHDHLDFLTGAADFVVHINKATPWDHAAPLLAAAEAGGFTGEGEAGAPFDPTHYGPAFLLTAANADRWQGLHAALYPPLAKSGE